MIIKDKKFCYRHKPTGKWVYLDGGAFMDLIDEISTENLYAAKNIIEEDLINSCYKNERYAAKNFLEFELVEVEIEYKVNTKIWTNTK